MSLVDWVGAARTNQVALPLTREVLDDAMRQAAKRGVELTHDCRFDGHVVAAFTTRCIFCGKRA